MYILMYILIDRYNDVINQGGRVCQEPIVQDTINFQL